MALARWTGRAVGLDVHRDFCVVAICDAGEVCAAGRVPSTPDDLRLLAESLAPTDRVALEVTGSCWVATVTRRERAPDGDGHARLVPDTRRSSRPR